MSKNYFEDCKAAVKTMLYPDLQPGKTLPEGKLEEFLDMMLMARDEWRNNINRDAKNTTTTILVACIRTSVLGSAPIS